MTNPEFHNDAAYHRLLKLIAEFDQCGGDAAGELEQVEAVYFENEDGMWVIRATMPEEVGSLLIKAIESFIEPTQGEKQSRKNVSAETSATALRSIAPHTDG